MLRSWSLGVAVGMVASLLAACSEGSGSGGSGGQAAGGSGAAGNAGGGGGAVIPAQHPRIYLNEANRERLSASLDAGDAAAVRFHDMVDGQLAGGDVYAFEPH